MKQFTLLLFALISLNGLAQTQGHYHLDTTLLINVNDTFYIKPEKIIYIPKEERPITILMLLEYQKVCYNDSLPLERIYGRADYLYCVNKNYAYKEPSLTGFLNYIKTKKPCHK
jgi:hypothetical protein